MKPFYLIAASALALTTAACGNGPPKTRAALDCPPTQGDLTRTGVAPGGKACTYVSSEGAEVTLQLVSVQGGPDATLKTIETSLLLQQPTPAAKPEEGKPGNGKAPPKAEAQPAAAAADDGTKDAATAEREAMADARGAAGDHDSSDRGGGKSVTVAHGTVIVDDDETTHVNLPGIHIDADDRNDTARVDIGPLHVNAGDGGATIRIRRDVRLKGEALAREKRGLRATFISERKDLTEGYHFVGYEAGGPKVGPLTVAVVKAKTEIDQGDRVYKAIRKLVRDNGGV